MFVRRCWDYPLDGPSPPERAAPRCAAAAAAHTACLRPAHRGRPRRHGGFSVRRAPTCRPLLRSRDASGGAIAAHAASARVYNIRRPAARRPPPRVPLAPCLAALPEPAFARKTCAALVDCAALVRCAVPPRRDTCAIRAHVRHRAAIPYGRAVSPWPRSLSMGASSSVRPTGVRLPTSALGHLICGQKIYCDEIQAHTRCSRCYSNPTHLFFFFSY